MKTAAVVLAAGQGRRFGGDKLLADLEGRHVIDHALDAVLAYPFETVVCVVRPDSRVAQLVKGRAIVPVINSRADLGMGTSLGAGIAALPPVDAAFIVLGDMPWLPRDLFGRMVEAMATSNADIVVPLYNGQHGHPVLFSIRCFPDLMELTGDTGAKALIRSGTCKVAFVEGHAGILRDIDVPGDLDGV